MAARSFMVPTFEEEAAGDGIAEICVGKKGEKTACKSASLASSRER